MKVINLWGGPGAGKAQPLDAKILTPDGWKLMKDMKIGTEVIVPNGEVSKVVGVYPQGIKDVYKITFNDGRSAECCKDHLWMIYGKYGDTYKTKSNYTERKLDYKSVTLEWIIDKLKTNKKQIFRIPMVKNLNAIDAPLPIDPWILGFLLGDGCFSSKRALTYFSTGDSEIIKFMSSKISSKYKIHKTPQKYGYNIRFIDPAESVKGQGKRNVFRNYYKQLLFDLGLSGTRSYNKFIPDLYKHGSTSQKEDLIAGLVDSDGYIDKNGSISISTSSKQMAKDIQEIIWSLGGQAKIKEKIPKYTYKGIKKSGRINYNVGIRYPEPKKLSKLMRKKNRLPENYQYSDLKLRIENIEYSRTTEAQCIMIDHPDHLYITNDYVVTHNSTTAAGLFYEMKKAKLSVELVTEYAKDAVWERRYDLFDDQIYIFAKQQRRIARLKNHNIDWVITDSPIPLGLIYVKPENVSKTFADLVLEVFNSYENYNYLLQRHFTYDPVGRNQKDEFEAVRFDVKVKDLLGANNVPFEVIHGGQIAIDKILNEVVKPSISC